MIWHQAITDNFCTGCQLLPYFPYKENIIAVVEENRLFIIAPVINVITFILYKVHIGFFRRFSRVGTLKATSTIHALKLGPQSIFANILFCRQYGSGRS
jgi:hypothetical protein